MKYLEHFITMIVFNWIWSRLGALFSKRTTHTTTVPAIDHRQPDQSFETLTDSRQQPHQKASSVRCISEDPKPAIKIRVLEDHTKPRS